MTTEALFPAMIRTKLYRPPLPADWVPRPRLLEQLRQQRERPLTLVSAPAGFGKSTLISAWLERCDWRSAWLSLDEGDNDLVTCLSYVVAAVRTVFPDFGTESQALLNAVNVPPVPVLAGSLTNELDEIDEPFVLVLDDYQVIHNQAIHELLSTLLSNPPRALHLVLAARHDPPLPISRLRAYAAVSEIRSPHLRFTLSETVAFLRQALDPQIDEARAALFNGKTEGWVTGLRLLVISLRLKAETDLAVGDAPLHDAHVLDYFIDEVLTRQTDALQDFLVKTSILDRMNGSLCEAVVELDKPVGSGQAHLEWLNKSNLFIVPLDERHEWFRYHQLFRQLLKRQLQRRAARDEIAALHQRASRWFVTHDLPEEAVQHALLAGDPEGAERVVAQQRHALMNQDDWHRLETLLQALPQPVVDERPAMLLTRGWSAYNRYNLLQMPALIDRAEDLLAQDKAKPDLAHAFQGEVAFFRGYQCFWANDMPGALARMQQALDQLPLEWWHARVAARLYLAGAYHMLGDSAHAATALAQGLDEARTNGPYLMRSFMITCFVHWLAGDLQGVIDAADRTLALGQKYHYPQTANWARYFRGIAHYHRNNLAQAEQDLSAVVVDRYRTHTQCLLHDAIALAFTYQAQQQPSQAQLVADLLPTFLYEAGNTILMPTLHAFQANLALQQGRLAEASQWAVQARPTSVSLMPHFFAPQLVLPKVLLALNTTTSRAAAAEQLAQLHEFTESRHHVHVLIEVLAVQAVLLETQGDRPAALAVLQRAIELAQSGGFIRLFVDLGRSMEELLRQLYDQGVAPYFVAQILAAFALPHPIGSAASLERPELIESLTRRELEVLTLLEQRLSNKEIAARLFITLPTAKLHTLHIYQKLQINTRRDAVAKAQSLGLLTNR